MEEKRKEEWEAKLERLRQLAKEAGFTKEELLLFDIIGYACDCCCSYSSTGTGPNAGPKPTPSPSPSPKPEEV